MGRAELAQCCIGGFCAAVIEASHGDAACNLALKLVRYHMHRTGAIDEGLHATRYVREIVGRSHDDTICFEHLLFDLFHIVIFDAAFWLEQAAIAARAVFDVLFGKLDHFSLCSEFSSSRCV